jgi:hypothetical protein
MASPAQLNANRLNAQRSTGPRTVEGKSVSRFNALSYGIEAKSRIIPGEDPAELETLSADYRTQFNPVGPLEGYLVESLIAADWNRRRYTRIEGALLQSAMAQGQSAVDALTGKPAQQIARALASAERLFFRALKELRRAQRERFALQETEDPADTPEPSHRAAINRAAAVRERSTLPPSVPTPEIGFVPSDRQQIPAGAPVAPLRP